jgi:molecular chaperone GrpE
MPIEKGAADRDPTAEARATIESDTGPGQQDEDGGQGEPDAASVSGSDSAELDRLRSELTEARERADRYHSNWQRSAADFQNWKRRADQERADAERQAEAALTAELLRVLDDFERAFQAVPPELRTLTWVEGVLLIWHKMVTVLQSRGLSPIEAVGQAFDPYVHEAVMREEDGDPSEQTSVVAELQRGYRFHDRVIRATLVKVGKPKETAAADDSGGASAHGADGGDAEDRNADPRDATTT